MSTEYVLRRATEAQWLASVANTQTEWGGSLPLEQYEQRERLLKDETGMGRGFQCWVLLPADAPSDSTDICCSVETFRRPILYLPPSSISSSSLDSTPEIKRLVGYSIASVFTPTKNRKQGYAKRMMGMLHSQLAIPAVSMLSEVDQSIPELDSQGDQDALLSWLYSDVGDFYSRCRRAGQPDGEAWQIQGITTTTWSLPLPSPSFSIAAPQGFASHHITSFDFARIAREDARLLRQSLATSPAKSDRGAFLAEPTEGAFQWAIQRSAHSYAARGKDTPTVWGVELRSEAAQEQTTEDGWSFILFTLDAHKLKSKVLRLRLAQPSHAPYLLADASRLLQEQGQSKLIGWEVSQEALDELRKVGGDEWAGKTVEREDSLSAVAFYGEGNGAVEWRINEGYAWC